MSKKQVSLRKFSDFQFDVAYGASQEIDEYFYF